MSTSKSAITMKTDLKKVDLIVYLRKNSSTDELTYVKVERGLFVSPVCPESFGEKIAVILQSSRTDGEWL